MTRKELIAYDKWLMKRKWVSGEIISPEKAADLYLAENPLPPAEGAESAEAFIKRKHPQDWDEIPQWHIDEIKEFATLHAQRIAERMVDAKTSRNGC